ncbi:unnamed protein product [Didymodactylos carnosus]|uniref:G-protein coupled receptors family 1 profile domain-containing protein n=1 Tax=Didymodactylos carnosus TaxID=1234261 RepID=A0A8S2GWD2_9BILA|nr:unnamed protein product [Didymodactylos carnosus]CAF3569118.1 unnamed protein product [Didymodactylos carnosus]
MSEPIFVFVNLDYSTIITVNATLSQIDHDKFTQLTLLKICLFGIFFLCGLIGNSLVLIGIGLNKGMQTPTNLLIFNLAVADILFIIFCIPTTLYTLANIGRWPFGALGCKLAQFINHLSAFMSIYLLVAMSFDRALWFIGIAISIPIGCLFTVLSFNDDQGKKPASYCLLKYLQTNYSMPLVPLHSINRTSHYSPAVNEYNSIVMTNTTNDALPYQASVYWIGFVVFLYALPLICIVILYGLMLEFLRGAHGSQVNRSKRRATRMILAVVLTYASCWFSMQLLFISNVVIPG